MMTPEQFTWVVAAPAVGIAAWLLWRKSRFLVGWLSCLLTAYRMVWVVRSRPSGLPVDVERLTRLLERMERQVKEISR